MWEGETEGETRAVVVFASGHIMAEHSVALTGQGGGGGRGGEGGVRHNAAPQHTPPAALLLTDIYTHTHTNILYTYIHTHVHTRPPHPLTHTHTQWTEM